MCHRASVGGEVPDLRIVQPSLETMNAVVIGGALKANGMPQFASLKPEDLREIYAYVINSAWDSHNQQQ